jgi:hypothetical protein
MEVEREVEQLNHDSKRPRMPSTGLRSLLHDVDVIAHMY